MCDPPAQEPYLDRVIEVDEVEFDFDAGSRIRYRCRIHVTTPEQEPALVTLRLEVLLKDRPTTTNDALGERLLRLAAERLSGIPPGFDPPEPE